MEHAGVIFLVGYMGSGKTTLGRKLARSLGLPFIDLDAQIEADLGRTIPEIFATWGEVMFREHEAAALRALDTDKAAVIAVGGGTPCYHENMSWMNQHGRTLYLQLSPRALWHRLERSDVRKRPVLQGLQGKELLHFIEEKLAEREPFYLQARLVVDQLNEKVPQIVEKISGL